MALHVMEPAYLLKPVTFLLSWIFIWRMVVVEEGVGVVAWGLIIFYHTVNNRILVCTLYCFITIDQPW